MVDVAKTGDPIDVSDAIAHMRQEIQKAMAEGVGKPVRFRAKGIELELSVELKRVGEGRAGIKAWVLDFGGKVGIENKSAHKVKLQLELPRDTLIGDEDEPPVGSDPEERRHRQ